MPAFDGGAFDALAFDVSASVTIPGVGPAGAATFVLSLQDGFQVSFAWSTDVIKSYNGLERRSSAWGGPKLRFTGTARLLRGDVRTVRTAVVAAAAAGQPFLLALPHEALTLAADAPSSTLTVWSTAQSDWAQPGQRAVVLGIDGATVSAGVVQSTSSTTVALDVAPTGSAARFGAELMPALAVFLDPTQSTDRYAVHADDWKLVATSALYGWGGADVMGAGATLTVFDGRFVWDRGNQIEDTAPEGFESGAELLDLGGIVGSFGAAPAVDWLRDARLQGQLASGDYQWLKAFLFAVRGACVAWLRPSNHEDLVYVSVPSAGTLKIAGPPTSGAGNYVTWWAASPAHRRLAITKTDGTVQYAVVTGAPGDNGDGTITCTLSVVLTGTVAKVSFLELCRFEDGGDGEEDVFEVAFAGGSFSFEHVARVVQQ